MSSNTPSSTNPKPLSLARIEQFQALEKKHRAYSYLSGVNRDLNQCEKQINETNKNRVLGVTEAGRRQCVLWMKTICDLCMLNEFIYCLSVNIFDRFLSIIKLTSTRQLQLIAASCFYLASKVAEEYETVPNIHCVIKAADNAFTKKDMVRMEIIILKRLDWELHTVTPLDFLRCYLEAKPWVTFGIEQLAKSKRETLINTAMTNILQLSLSLHYLKYPPSTLAMCSLVNAFIELFPTVSFGYSNTDSADDAGGIGLEGVAYLVYDMFGDTISGSTWDDYFTCTDEISKVLVVKNNKPNLYSDPATDTASSNDKGNITKLVPVSPGA